MKLILEEDALESITIHNYQNCSICGKQYDRGVVPANFYYDENKCECDDCQKEQFIKRKLTDEETDKIAKSYIRKCKDGMGYNAMPSYLVMAQVDQVKQRVDELIVEEQQLKLAEKRKKYETFAQAIIEDNIKPGQSDIDFIKGLIASVLEYVDNKISESKSFDPGRVFK